MSLPRPSTWSGKGYTSPSIIDFVDPAFDLVEVAPVYDHAEITGMLAANVTIDLSIMLAANVTMDLSIILAWQKCQHCRNGAPIHARKARAARHP